MFELENESREEIDISFVGIEILSDKTIDIYWEDNGEFIMGLTINDAKSFIERLQEAVNEIENG